MARGLADISKAMTTWSLVDKSRINDIATAYNSLFHIITKESAVALLKKVSEGFTNAYTVFSKFSVHWHNLFQKDKAPWVRISMGRSGMTPANMGIPKFMETTKAIFGENLGKIVGGGKILANAPGISKVVDKVKNFGQAIGNFGRDVAGKAAISFGTFSGKFSLWKDQMGKAHPVLAAGANVVSGFAGGVAKIGGKVGMKAAGAMGNLVKSMGSMGMFSIQQMALEGIMTVIFSLLDAINPFKPIIEAISQAFSILGGVMSAQLAPIVEKVFSFMLSPTMIALFEKLGSAFALIFEAISPVIEVLVTSALIPLLTMLADVLVMFAPVIKVIADVLVMILVPALNVVMWIIKLIANVVITVYNIIAGIINFFVFWTGFQLPIMNLMPMAKGGDMIVKKPTLFLAGEAGPERATFTPGGGSPAGEGQPSIVVNIYGAVYGEADIVDKVTRALAQSSFVLR